MLVYEREPMELVGRAVASDDEVLRVTALEYLDNVWSPDLCEAVWQLIEQSDARAHKHVES